MAFNISKFSSVLNKTGVLKNNKFDIQIAYPEILKNDNALFEEMMFRAQSVQVPGVNLETEQINRYGIGVRERFPIRTQYDDSISITFIEREDSSIRDLMTKWINSIINFHSVTSYSTAPTYLARYKDTYEAYMIITHYKDYNEEVSNKYGIVDTFPISLSSIPLGWSENNLISLVQVEFAFTEWFSFNLQESINPLS